MIADRGFRVDGTDEAAIGLRNELLVGGQDLGELPIAFMISGSSGEFSLERVCVRCRGEGRESRLLGTVPGTRMSAPTPAGLSHIHGLGSDSVFGHVSVDLARVDQSEVGLPLEVEALVVLPGGERRSVSATTLVRFSPLPRPRGWLAGDTHLHTSHSDGWLGMESVVKYAHDVSGVSWLILADHSHQIDWKEYIEACLQAQNTHGILVCPGVEFKTGRPMPNGHALGYALDPDRQLPKAGQSPQEIISEIEGQRPESFAVIAHPYSPPYDWPDWTTEGFEAIELATGGGDRANAKARSRWFGLLAGSLEAWDDTSEPPPFVVGLASTDSHEIPVLPMPGEKHVTWVNTGSPAASLQAAELLATIRRGRCVASCSGDFGVLLVNGSDSGSVCRASANPRLDLEFRFEPRGGHSLAEVMLHGPDGIAGQWRPDEKSPLRVSLAPPSSPTFYIAQFVFSNDRGARCDVWTNPVWVCTD